MIKNSIPRTGPCETPEKTGSQSEKYTIAVSVVSILLRNNFPEM